MTKYGRPVSVVPASSTLAMLGWSISARACRSASKRAITCLRVHAGLDDLEGDLALDRLGLLGHEDGAHAAFADLLQQLVGADRRARVPRPVRCWDGATGGVRSGGRAAAGRCRKLPACPNARQQGLDALPEFGIVGASLVEIGGSGPPGLRSAGRR